MHAPPDPSSERAPLQERPDRKFLHPCSGDISTEAVADFQAASLRRRFALAHYLAVTVAPLIWGLPR